MCTGIIYFLFYTALESSVTENFSIHLKRFCCCYIHCIFATFILCLFYFSHYYLNSCANERLNKKMLLLLKTHNSFLQMRKYLFLGAIKKAFLIVTVFSFVLKRSEGGIWSTSPHIWSILNGIQKSFNAIVCRRKGKNGLNMNKTTVLKEEKNLGKNIVKII